MDRIVRVNDLLVLLLILFGLGLGVSAFADDREIQVNEYTLGVQDQVKIVRLAGGDFLVVWRGRSPDQVDDEREIRGRLLDSTGQPTGAEFNIGQTGTSWQGWADVAALEDGSAAVAWWDLNGSGRVGHRRVSAVGVPLGQPDLITTDPENFAREDPPVIAPRSGGGYLIVWECWPNCLGARDRDLFGQLFDANSSSLTDPFRITEGSEGQIWRYYSVVSLGGDGFMVFWTDRNDDQELSYRGRRLDVDGNLMGGEYLIPDLISGDRAYKGGPGEFILQTVNGFQRYNAAVQPVGSPIQLPPSPAEDFTYLHTDLIVAANGDVWFPLLTGFTAGPTAFEFDIGLYVADATGQPLLVMTQINALAGGSQRDGSLALTTDGDPVVVWESEGSFGDDNSRESIQVRTSFSMLFADDFETGDLARWNFSMP